MNGRWPFRRGTALGIGILVLLVIGVSAWISRSAADNLPVGYVGAGEPVYAEYCSSCHGTWADGTEAAPSLLVPELARSGYSNQRMATAIRKGRGEMPGTGLELQDTADVIAFVRDLQETPVWSERPSR